MILTVTLNPSVDISYPIKEFKLDDVNRVTDTIKTAGGKGLNVTRVLNDLKKDVIATGFTGGKLGEFISEQLTLKNINNKFYTIKGDTRNCIAILHEGHQTEILESGPTILKLEAEEYLPFFEKLASVSNVITISGSLPEGLPSDYYRYLIEIADSLDIPVVLDTSGESLKQVLLSNNIPYMIKPNIDELTVLLNNKVVDTLEGIKEALSEELFSGIEWVVVSRGEKGAVAKHKETFFQVDIPKINVINPVGSGDATVAGLALAISEEKSDEEILKTAMACGVLNTMEEKTGHVNLNKFSYIYNQINVKVF
ncbi:tagatose-6-phosphate kinase [Dolosicoccus paucivorans]|uniref:tagatose-6-phosphate kinase n=1 Tax=Dolosicoccus paucivorans TaxID=84521 RepID=UPI000C7F7F80|nr:tagatose-6-phosphate kinase [Dolosicoccus paucivorans]PMB85160.1 tagatose-6-phosphate kinase [Dolosicoccus paucivorans]